MSRAWSLFFLLMPLAAVALFAAAPALGWSLPDNVSTLGAEIDSLYTVIFFVTATVFIGTQFFLVWLMFRFGDGPGKRAVYTHGSKRAELAWTMIPAAIIAGIAALQMPTWWKLQETPANGEQYTARVVGRRFAWEVVHAGADGKLNTLDDLTLDNELHVPPGKRIWIELTSKDVIHAFFLPHMRMKQDAVPGLKIPVQFDARQSTLAYREKHADFVAGDVFDGLAIASALNQHKRPVDEWLYRRLASGSVVRIDELNKLLTGDDWTGDADWKDVKPSAATAELAAYKTKYPKSYRRALLADAYPNALRRLHRDYELICAELCGDGHYQMVGKVIVHESAEEYQAWLRSAATRHPQEAGR